MTHMTEKLKIINTVNAAIICAEQMILAETGMRMRLMVVPEISINGKQRMVPEKMLHVLANALNAPPDVWTNRKRSRGLVELRQLGCYFLKQFFPGLTYLTIGELMGGYDHTSVMYSIKAAKDRIDIDEVFCKMHDAGMHAVTQWAAMLENMEFDPEIIGDEK
jgi:chromosomal replication initiation ATPase DnaA